MSNPPLSLQPLAAQLRPKTLAEFIGQQHLLGERKSLRIAIEQGQLHSMILWGPPGTGKTTLAQLLAGSADAELVMISAVLAGVKEIRAAIELAQQRLTAGAGKTVLFVDEVHRFNKSQQDAFLPYVENGTVTFIGATTENPSFALNNALLSRARVYILKRLSESELLQIISQTVAYLKLDFPISLRSQLILAADGDARRCINLLELAGQLALGEQGVIDQKVLDAVLTEGVRRFDNKGEDFYDQISALHKAVRGTNPDGALYWLTRMLDAGCDPQYILRRIVRMASEDIGNADPRALQIALDAWSAYQRLGSPEGDLMIAQAVIYLAVAPKSNAVYTAFQATNTAVKQYGSLEVPLHLRNAPTQLMKQAHYAKGYRYAHDEPHAYAAGETYLPPELKGHSYYHPVERGLEMKIKEKLQALAELDAKSHSL